MQPCKNSRGFTLIESMIALSFLVILASLFPLWLQVTNHPEKKETINLMELELFFQEISMEIRESVGISQNNSADLTLQKDRFKNGHFITVNYKRRGENIQRYVNWAGYQPVLQNISDVQFTPIQKGAKITGVKITVKGKKGETYERTYAQMVPQE